MNNDEASIDVTTDVLILLVDILGTCDRILARARRRPAHLERIRALARQLEDEVLRHWADEAARDAPDPDEREIHFDDPFDDHDL